VLAFLACSLIVYARIVYTPQAMMVEGKGVFDALGRSFTLAKGEFLRIGAVLLFQIWVAWSLYALLLVPLGWYSYFYESEGLSLTNLFDTTGPLWFNIAQQTLTQIGEILIAPIVLLSFTLLYINSRVRKEGFDVELVANRALPPAKYEVQAPAYVETAPPSLPRRAIDWSAEFASDESIESSANAQPLPASDATPPEPQPITDEPLNEPLTETIELTPIAAALPPAAGSQAETEARFCQRCGTNLNERARFCPHCGEKL